MPFVGIFEFENLSSEDALLMELLGHQTFAVLLAVSLLRVDVEVILGDGVDLVGEVGHNQVGAWSGVDILHGQLGVDKELLLEQVAVVRDVSKQLVFSLFLGMVSLDLVCLKT